LGRRRDEDRLPRLGQARHRQKTRQCAGFHNQL
jgi:hypothetical protein